MDFVHTYFACRGIGGNYSPQKNVIENILMDLLVDDNL